MQRRLALPAIILTDYDLLPFQVDRSIIRKAQEVTRFSSELEKYHGIFAWMKENIRHKKAKGYRNSLEVFYQQEGVCGEQAFLFIAMARLVNLPAFYASVTKDCYKENVFHGCVAAGKMIIDTSYQLFPAHHKEYKILTDEEVGQCYQQWRYET